MQARPYTNSRYRSPSSWGGRRERHHHDGRSADERRSDEQRDAFARAVGAVAVEGPYNVDVAAKAVELLPGLATTVALASRSASVLERAEASASTGTSLAAGVIQLAAASDSCVSLSGAAAMPA
ncbi:hypothetical protein ACFVFJ_45355 [Streptomyces sp. NPDC057717]|uniref:hypothetical protein n=1 Tax=Streptomyces sp. NPDC057717 TaxID=3346224 RepID=UPI00369F5120